MSKPTLPPTSEDKRNVEALEAEGGRLLQQRAFSKAQELFQKAAALYSRENNFPKTAAVQFQMGIACQGEKDWQAAENNYKNALILFRETGDRFQEAESYHQLGVVGQASGNLEMAAGQRKSQESNRKQAGRYVGHGP
ncbi:MAG: tetratricopeptide repeat protein [bacterium]|nr:tetratricopeptide repeat protein [bacterium]